MSLPFMTETDEPAHLPREAVDIISGWSTTDPVGTLAQTESLWKDGRHHEAALCFSVYLDLWTLLLPLEVIDRWSLRIASSNLAVTDPLLAIAWHHAVPARTRLSAALMGLERFDDYEYQVAAELASLLLPASIRGEAEVQSNSSGVQQAAYERLVSYSEAARRRIDISSFYLRARAEYLPPVPRAATVVYDSGLDSWEQAQRVEVFPFFQESKMLETRLLSNGDAFSAYLLIEGATDYRGQPKSSVFREQFSEDFRRSHRIRHVIVDFPTTTNPWVRERLQRDAAVPFLMDLEADALIVSSDLDELIHPGAIERIEAVTRLAPCAIEQDMYRGNLDGFYASTGWSHPKALRRLDLPESLSSLRLASLPAVKAGGWHLTYFGSLDEIWTKIRSFAHTETDDIVKSDQDVEIFLGDLRGTRRPQVPFTDAILQIWGNADSALLGSPR
jgi:hypothetical protein